MTIIPSNMIGHFLVHSTILPSRSSPSALHWLQKLKRPLAVQLRSSCEKLGKLFLCRRLIPAMMKIKGRAKNIDNDVGTDWSWCCGCFQKWENTIHQHHSQHTLTVILFLSAVYQLSQWIYSYIRRFCACNTNIQVQVYKRKLDQ